MSNEVEAKLHLGGVPTGPDVKKLMEHFPVEHGTVVPYSDIERVLGMSRRRSRFRTVTVAWRRTLLREPNLLVVPTKLESFKCLTEAERSEYEFRDGFAIGFQKCARHERRTRQVDTAHLDERELSSHTHRQRVMSAVVEHGYTQLKEIATPSPPRQLPRRRG